MKKTFFILAATVLLFSLGFSTINKTEDEELTPCELIGQDKNNDFVIKILSFSAKDSMYTIIDKPEKMLFITATVEVTNTTDKSYQQVKADFDVVHNKLWKDLDGSIRINIDNFKAKTTRTYTSALFYGSSSGIQNEIYSIKSEDIGLYTSSGIELEINDDESERIWCYSFVKKFTPFSDRKMEKKVEIEIVKSQNVNGDDGTEAEVYVKNFENTPAYISSMEVQLGIYLEKYKQGDLMLMAAAPPTDHGYFIKTNIVKDAHGESYSTELDPKVADKYIGTFKKNRSGIYEMILNPNVK